MTKRWKFLLTGYKSNYGDHKWTVGKWYEFDGELNICESGFHCSKGVYQAFSYVQGEILAQVEVGGKSVRQDDKEVYSKMRVIKTYKWTKKDSVLFSIYAAYLCLNNFEKVFPKDKKPREAIEASEKYAKNPTEKNRLAARSAARSAAESARSAAWSAARSAAWSAAESAWSAAESAWSARSAAWSAARSAESAESAVYKKLDKWMLSHVKGLKVLKSI